jgi:hypothetical protein
MKQVLHQAGVSFDLYYDAWKHKIKIQIKQVHTAQSGLQELD